MKSALALVGMNVEVGWLAAIKEQSVPSGVRTREWKGRNEVEPNADHLCKTEVALKGSYACRRNFAIHGSQNTVKIFHGDEYAADRIVA